MIEYSVTVSPLARTQIARYAEYIVESSGSLEVGNRWVFRVYTTTQSLSHFPQRFGLAEENDHREYEIRRLVIGKYLALYHIEESVKIIRVIGFRHGARLPRPDELPVE